MSYGEAQLDLMIGCLIDFGAYLGLGFDSEKLFTFLLITSLHELEEFVRGLLAYGFIA